jgi:hypothetical protein
LSALRLGQVISLDQVISLVQAVQNAFRNAAALRKHNAALTTVVAGRARDFVRTTVRFLKCAKIIILLDISACSQTIIDQYRARRIAVRSSIRHDGKNGERCDSRRAMALVHAPAPREHRLSDELSSTAQ